jgi:Ni,Fe-hydrogenase III small subunit/formate hydrogenlyase subunit 6/NADH:ubiquinone oxidoreductase subunit I
MLRIVLNALRTGVVTTRYPAVPSVPPERFRGAPVLRPGSHLPPPDVCPVGAISERFDDGHRLVALDLGRCVFCGRCADDPWSDAITMGREFELAARNRDDLLMEVVADEPTVRGPETTPSGETEAVRITSAIHRVLGHSLQLRHLDAGSCNACDWELTALLNPIYDVRRLGVDFVASPRHADGVIVTGSVTRNLETAVRRTVEAVPDPRIVIAVGACAVSGGIAGEGYASAGGVDRVLPVDVYIPGCPPRPEAIIFGILAAVGRLDTRRAVREVPSLAGRRCSVQVLQSIREPA